MLRSTSVVLKKGLQTDLSSLSNGFNDVSSHLKPFSAFRQYSLLKSPFFIAAPTRNATATLTATVSTPLRLQYRHHSDGGEGENPRPQNPYNLFRQYVWFCNEYQMTAAIVTSFCLWSLGDVITQKMEQRSASAASSSSEKEATPPSAKGSDGTTHSKSSLTFFESINTRRLAATAFFGVSIIGIGGFYWYRLLDKLVTQRLGITPAKSGFAKFTAAKLGLELLIWHPITLALFWMVVGVGAEGESVSAVARRLPRELPTALAADVSLWLPIDIINFRFTPVHLQVIVVNLGSLIEAVLLSYIHGSGGDGHAHSHHGVKSGHEAEGAKCVVV